MSRFRALVSIAVAASIFVGVRGDGEGQLSFVQTSLTIAENQRSIAIEVTRSCPGIPQNLCSGDVSVVVSTEAPPAVPLAATAALRVGSARVNTSADIRGQLSQGQVVSVGVPNEIAPELATVHRTLPMPDDGFWLEAPFAASALPVTVQRIDNPLPGFITVDSGATLVRTSEDLEHMVSRGDRVKVGDQMRVVAAEGVFNASHLTLATPYTGPPLSATRLFRDRRYLGLTNSDHARSERDVYVTASHGSAVLWTTLSLTEELFPGESVKFGTETYPVAAVNASAITLDRPFASYPGTVQGLAGFKSTIRNRLPGTVAVTAASRTVATSHDLREHLALGDRVRVGGFQHTVTLPFTAALLTLDRPFAGASAAEAEAFSDRVYEPVFGRVSVAHGSAELDTEFDLRLFVARGDTVKIGYRAYSVGHTGVFNATRVPLSEPFEGPAWTGVQLHTDAPNPRTTATPGADYVPTTTRLFFPHKVTSQSAVVRVLDDAAAEAPDEAVHLRLWGARYESVETRDARGLTLHSTVTLAAPPSAFAAFTTPNASLAHELSPGDVVRVLGASYTVASASALGFNATTPIAGGPRTGVVVIKERPSTLAAKTDLTLTITNDDPSVTTDALGLTVSGSAGSAVLTATTDARAHVWPGDRLRIGRTGKAVEVQSVAPAGAITLTAPLAAAASAAPLFRASNPDRVGTIQFAAASFEALESAHGPTGRHPSPPRSSMQLPGTATVSAGSASVSTSNDLRTDLAVGATVTFGSDATQYTVAAVAASAITLSTPFTGTPGTGTAHRAMDARRAVVRLIRTGGDSGAVSAQVATCASSSAAPCTGAAAATATDAGASDGVVQLPGVAVAPIGASALTTTQDWRGRVSPGDVLWVGHETVVVGGWAEPNASFVPLGSPDDFNTPSPTTHEHSASPARALTRAVPGRFDTQAGGTRLVSLSDPRDFLRAGAIVKVANDILQLSNAELPTAAPLGELPGGTVAVAASAPSTVVTTAPAGTGRVQLLRCVADGGSFRLRLRDQETPPISFSASAADLERALLEVGRITGVRATLPAGQARVCAAQEEPVRFVVIELLELWGFSGTPPRLVPDTGALQRGGVVRRGFILVSLPPSLRRGDLVRIAGHTSPVAFNAPLSASSFGIDVPHPGPFPVNATARRVAALSLCSAPPCALPRANVSAAAARIFLGATVLPFTLSLTNGANTATPSSDPRHGWVQHVECVAGGGTFRLHFAREHTQPIAVAATTATLKTALERLEAVAAVTVTGPSGAICAGTWAARETVSVTFTSVLGGGDVLPPLLADGAKLTGATTSLRTWIRPGLQRGDAVLAGAQVLTIRTDADLTSSSLPLSAPWDGVTASGVPVRGFQAAPLPLQTDYEEVVDETVVFGDGETYAEVSVPIRDDPLAEPDESVVIGIHRPRAECSPSPCVFEDFVMCEAPSGVFRLWYGDSSTSHATEWMHAENATAAGLESALEGLSTVTDVRVYATRRDGALPDDPRICSGSGRSKTLAFVRWVDPPGTMYGTPPKLVWAEAGGDLAAPAALSVSRVTPAAEDTATGFAAPVGTQQQATVVVVDDGDAAGTLGFTAATITGTEASQSVFVTVTRTSGAGSALVHYTTRDSTALSDAGALGTGQAPDYRATSGVLSFEDGVTRLGLRIEIYDDIENEGDETFSLHLSDLSGDSGVALGTSTVTVTITDNDSLGDVSGGSVGFRESMLHVSEDDHFAVLHIIRDGPFAGAIDLVVNTTAVNATSSATLALGQTTGGDFVSQRIPVQFGEGVSEQAVVVPLVDNAKAESMELFHVSLEDPVRPCTAAACRYSIREARRTATVVVSDDGDEQEGFAIGLNAPAYTVREDEGFVLVTVVRRGAARLPLSARIHTSSSGTAAAQACPLTSPGTEPCEPMRVEGTHADFWEVNETVTIPAGVSQSVVLLRIYNDTEFESPDESFSISLTAITSGLEIVNGSAGTGLEPTLFDTATVTIEDDGDTPGFIGFANAEVSHPESDPVVWVTITRTGGDSGTISAQYSTCGDGGHNAICLGVGSSAVEGELDHPAARYAFSSGKVTFGPGVRRQVIPIRVIDDACRTGGTETIEVALGNVSFLGQAPCSIVPGSGGTCMGIQTARTTIKLLDPEDAPQSEPAWLNIRRWPGTTPRVFLVSIFGPGNTSTSDGAFRLRLRDTALDLAATTLPILANASADIAGESPTGLPGARPGESVQARLEALSVLGRVRVTAQSVPVSNGLARGFFVEPDVRDAALMAERWELEVAESLVLPAGSSVTISTVSSPEESHAAGQTLTPAPEVEVRSTCDRPIVDAASSSITVSAHLVVPWHAQCLVQAATDREEIQSMYLAPLRLLDSNLKVVHGSSSLFTSVDLSTVLQVGEKVLIGGSGPSATVPIPANASVTKGSATVVFTSSVSDFISVGQMVRIRYRDFTVASVSNSTITLDTQYPGSTRPVVEVSRLPVEVTIRDTRALVNGTLCVERHDTQVLAANNVENGLDMNKLAANDELSIGGSTATIASVSGSTLTLSSAYSQGSSTTQIAYRRTADGGTRYILSANLPWSGVTTTGLVLYRYTKVAGTFGVLTGSADIVPSNDVTAEVNPGDVVSFSGVQYTIGSVGTSLLSLTANYTGPTRSALSMFLETSALNGTARVVNPESGASTPIPTSASAASMKLAVETVLPGTHVSISRSVSDGGYRWRMSYRSPRRDLPQVWLQPDVPGPYLVSSQTLVDGSQRYSIGEDGFVALPASGSDCGELLGTTTVPIDSKGVATFSDLRVSAGGVAYGLRFSTSSGPVTNEAATTVQPPRGGFSAISPFFSVHEASAAALGVAAQPDDAVSGYAFGQPAVVELRDEVIGGTEVAADSSSIVNAEIKLNSAGKGGARLFSTDLSKMEDLGVQVNGMAGNYTTTLSAFATSRIASGDVLYIDEQFYQVTSPVLVPGASATSELMRGAWKNELRSFSFPNATAGTITASYALVASETIPLFVTYEDETTITACTFDFSDGGGGGGPPGPGAGSSDSREYLYHDDGIDETTCGLVKADTIKQKSGFKDLIAWDKSESLPTLTFSFLVSKGNLDSIEISASATDENGNAVVPITTVQDGEGNLFAREVQVIRMSISPTPSLGFFSMRVNGNNIPIVLHEADATRSTRRSCYDGSLQALIESAAPSLGSVTVTTEEEQNIDTDTIYRSWKITFSNYDGDVPEIEVHNNKLATRALVTTSAGAEATVSVTYDSTSATLTQVGGTPSEATLKQYAVTGSVIFVEIWPPGATWSDIYEATVGTEASNAIPLTLNKPFRGLTSTSARLFICNYGGTRNNTLEVDTIQNGAATLPLWPRYAGAMNKAVYRPLQSVIPTVVEAGVANFDDLAILLAPLPHTSLFSLQFSLASNPAIAVTSQRFSVLRQGVAACTKSTSSVTSSRPNDQSSTAEHVLTAYLAGSHPSVAMAIDTGDSQSLSRAELVESSEGLHDAVLFGRTTRVSQSGLAKFSGLTTSQAGTSDLRMFCNYGLRLSYSLQCSSSNVTASDMLRFTISFSGQTASVLVQHNAVLRRKDENGLNLAKLVDPALKRAAAGESLESKLETLALVSDVTIAASLATSAICSPSASLVYITLARMNGFNSLSASVPVLSVSPVGWMPASAVALRALYDTGSVVVRDFAPSDSTMNTVTQVGAPGYQNRVPRAGQSTPVFFVGKTAEGFVSPLNSGFTSRKFLLNLYETVTDTRLCGTCSTASSGSTSVTCTVDVETENGLASGDLVRINSRSYKVASVSGKTVTLDSPVSGMTSATYVYLRRGTPSSYRTPSTRIETTAQNEFLNFTSTAVNVPGQEYFWEAASVACDKPLTTPGSVAITQGTNVLVIQSGGLPSALSTIGGAIGIVDGGVIHPHFVASSKAGGGPNTVTIRLQSPYTGNTLSGAPTDSNYVCTYPYEVQTLTTNKDSDDQLSGTFTLKFAHHGSTEYTRSISHNATGAELASELALLPNVNDNVNVYRTLSPSNTDPVIGSWTWYITFAEMGNVPQIEIFENRVLQLCADQPCPATTTALSTLLQGGIVGQYDFTVSSGTTLLRIETEPRGARAGLALTTQPRVALRDLLGSTDGGASGYVTAAVLSTGRFVEMQCFATGGSFTVSLLGFGFRNSTTSTIRADAPATGTAGTSLAEQLTDQWYRLTKPDGEPMAVQLLDGKSALPVDTGGIDIRSILRPTDVVRIADGDCLSTGSISIVPVAGWALENATVLLEDKLTYNPPPANDTGPDLRPRVNRTIVRRVEVCNATFGLSTNETQAMVNITDLGNGTTNGGNVTTNGEKVLCNGVYLCNGTVTLNGTIYCNDVILTNITYPAEIIPIPTGTICLRTVRRVRVSVTSNEHSICHPTSPPIVQIEFNRMHRSFHNTLYQPLFDSSGLTGTGGKRQSISCSPNVTSLTLTFRGQTTDALPKDASAAAVKAALESLRTVSGVSTTGTSLCSNMVVEFMSVPGWDFESDYVPPLKATVVGAGSVSVSGSGAVLLKQSTHVSLTGTKTIPVVKGWANFTDLSLTQDIGATRLRFIHHETSQALSSMPLKQALTCQASQGLFKLAFNGAATTSLDAASATASDIQAALEALETITSVSVSLQGVGLTTPSQVCTREGHHFAVITFTAVPNLSGTSDSVTSTALTPHFPTLTAQSETLALCGGTTGGSLTVTRLYADSELLPVQPAPGASLHIITEPAGAVAAVSFTTQPVLELRNAQGHRVLTDVLGHDVVSAYLIPTNRVQRIECRASGGSFAIRQDGGAVTISATATQTQIEAALQSLPLVSSVAVSISGGTTACEASTLSAVSITFTGYLNSGDPRVVVSPLEIDLLSLEGSARPYAQILLSNGTLSGTTSALMHRGRVAFFDLSIDVSGPSYLLCFAAKEVAEGEVCASPFAVAEGAPARLVVRQQPVSSHASAAALPLPVEVHVVDAGGRRVPTAVNTVSVGAVPAAISVAGADASKTAVSGIALFSSVVLGSTSPAAMLTFSAPGLEQANSTLFTVYGDASTLMLSTGPGPQELPGVVSAAPGSRELSTTANLVASLRPGEMVELDGAVFMIPRHGVLRPSSIPVHSALPNTTSRRLLRAATGGEAFPAQPVVRVLDTSGSRVQDDSSTVVTAWLSQPGCSGVLSGTNHRQTLRCKATSGSLMLTFRGETTTRLPHSATASDVQSALNGLPGVTTAQVSIEGASQLCDGNATGLTIVDFVSVPAVGLTAGTSATALRPVPLMFAKTMHTQAIVCNATGGHFSLTYEGHMTRAVPFDGTAAALKSALEDLPQVLQATVSLSSGSVLCSPDGSVTAFVGLQKTAGLIGTPPLFVVSSTSLSGAGADVSVTSNGLGSDAFVRISGSGTAVSRRGEAEFYDLAIDQACASLYRLSFAVVHSGSITGTQSAGFKVFVGRAVDLRVERELSECAIGEACVVQPRVAVVDAGGNISPYEDFPVTVSLLAGSQLATTGAVLLGSHVRQTSAGTASWSGAGLGLTTAGVGGVLGFVTSPKLEHGGSAVGKPFNVTGIARSLRLISHPPVSLAVGQLFSVVGEVADEYGLRLNTANISTTVSVSLLDNPPCPLHCAELSGAHSAEVRSGLVTFANLSVLRPTGTGSVRRPPSFRIKTSRVGGISSGTFTLAIDLASVGGSSTVTRPIAFNAVATIADETASSSTAGTGLGESVQSKLQQVVGLGPVTVQRVSLDAANNWFAWDVVLTNWGGRFPLPRLVASSLGAGSAVEIERTGSGDGFSLQVSAQLPGHHLPVFAQTRAFDVA